MGLTVTRKTSIYHHQGILLTFRLVLFLRLLEAHGGALEGAQQLGVGLAHRRLLLLPHLGLLQDVVKVDLFVRLLAVLLLEEVLRAELEDEVELLLVEGLGGALPVFDGTL